MVKSISKKIKTHADFDNNNFVNNNFDTIELIRIIIECYLLKSDCRDDFIKFVSKFFKIKNKNL